MIAVAGFVVCVICLSGAFALGGYDITKNGWSFPVQWNYDDEVSDLRNIDWKSPETTRDLAWAGDDELEVAVPADVTFTQGPTAKIVVTGPKDAVDKIVVDGGRIGFSGHNNVRVTVRGLNVNVRGLEGFRRLRIEVVAPEMRRIETSAASRMTITALKADDLEMSVNTASHIEGNIDVNKLDLKIHTGADARLEGRADDIDVEVHTGGDAKLDRLAVKTAKIETHTGGDAVAAPTESADIEAHTGGDVVLRSHPPRINSNIHTGGNLRFETGPAPSTNAPSTNAPAANAPAPAKPSVSPSPSPSPSPPKRT
jgi:hypothetical protein